MNAKKAFSWVGALLALAVIATAVVSWSAPQDRMKAEEIEWLRRMSYEFVRAEPILDKLKKTEDLIRDVSRTSATLEKLDELLIKAENVEKMNTLLARMEKLEPMLQSLEAMQEDFAGRDRKKTRASVKKLPTWSDIFGQFQTRLDTLEQRVYAPAVLDRGGARKMPVELRIKTLEERHETLNKEIEDLQRELRRLRRMQRQEGL